jgi:hypothetical protein
MKHLTFTTFIHSYIDDIQNLPGYTIFFQGLPHNPAVKEPEALLKIN